MKMKSYLFKYVKYNTKSKASDEIIEIVFLSLGVSVHACVSIVCSSTTNNMIKSDLSDEFKNTMA